MQEREQAEKNPEFLKISKRGVVDKIVSPSLSSYLDTVPVILSPLCGAKVVASRSSSNFL